MGDAIVFQQDLIPRGVDPTDETEPLDWSLDKGRYLFVPLRIRSEYIKNCSTMIIPSPMNGSSSSILASISAPLIMLKSRSLTFHIPYRLP